MNERGLEEQRGSGEFIILVLLRLLVLGSDRVSELGACAGGDETAGADERRKKKEKEKEGGGGRENRRGEPEGRTSRSKRTRTRMLMGASRGSRRKAAPRRRTP
jgi:hypothetical protein